MAASRLQVLVTSPRVDPGLLSAQAWRLLSAADVRLTPSRSDPVARAVVAAGLAVRESPDEVAELVAGTTGSVVWLAPHGDTSWTRTWAEHLVTGGPGRVSVEVVHGSYDVPGARLLDLVAVMDRLRTGCPWDREQTHASLAPYLLEETYETLEALDGGDRDHLREELGDLLLQVVFHARVAADDPTAPWDIDDVAAGIVDKLIRRHPHVFADVTASDAYAVEANWESIKATEKQRDSVLDGVPAALPALARADKILSRLSRSSLEPAAVYQGTLVNLTAHGLHPMGSDNLPWAVDDAAVIGDALLDLVRRAHAVGVDAEQALRTRLRALEEAARAVERES
ncbi:MAG: MazG family protein [Actinomycetota bacterium]|nr:MazG family protein [Actinomycetota bacterium]